MREYLQELDFPRLPRVELEAIEALITREEVGWAIKNMALGKSPGPDGYSILYYKRFQKMLVPKLCEYFSTLEEGEDLREESLLAYITLILKEGNDPTIPTSYRQISLLNTDIKIFPKIIAERLTPLLPKWIYNDQVGFMSGRKGRDNCLKSLLLINEVRKKGIPVVLLSIDGEKAFDRVNWGFVFKTVRCLEIGERMIRWISAFTIQRQE